MHLACQALTLLQCCQRPLLLEDLRLGAILRSHIVQ